MSLVSCDDADVAAAVGTFVDEWCDGEDYIIAHTSGSTSKPKPIKLLKRDMLLSAESTNRFFGIDSRSTMVCPLSVDYIAGKMMVVRAIAAGCRLWMERPSSAPLKNDYGRIDLLSVVPAQLPALLASVEKLHAVKALLIGGAAMTKDMEMKVADCGAAVYMSYGMTETCSHVALRRVGVSDIFEAIPGVTFDIDPRGCLTVVAPERSFKSLVTNDAVDLIDDRHFRWLGRIDNVINSGGIKVFPLEIEQRLSAILPEGTKYYITSDRHDRWGSTPVLVIEDVASLPVLAIMAAEIREALPAAKRPTKIIVVEKFSYTNTGKLLALPPDRIDGVSRIWKSCEAEAR